jgi:hypothetical protein
MRKLRRKGKDKKKNPKRKEERQDRNSTEKFSGGMMF